VLLFQPEAVVSTPKEGEFSGALVTSRRPVSLKRCQNERREKAGRDCKNRFGCCKDEGRAGDHGKTGRVVR